jgi:serine protease AprX
MHGSTSWLLTVRLIWSAAAVVAAALPMQAGAAAQPGEALHGRTAGTHTPHEVALPRGEIIHRTSRRVSGVRFIDVPGEQGEGVLALWDELEHGRFIPHYAYSLDGRSLRGRVRENEGPLKLRFLEFDPLRGGPALLPHLRAVPESRIHLVQFHATPLPEMQRSIVSIAGVGGGILRFIGDRAAIVRTDAESMRAIAALPFVRWAGPFHVAYKLDDRVALGVAAAMRGRHPEAERYSIELFDRGLEAQQRISDLVRALGGIVEVLTADGFRMEATLSPLDVLEVARRDEVHFVDFWGGPGGGDMSIVRQIGGAAYIESTLGLTEGGGRGVRAQVFDSELRTTHREFSSLPLMVQSKGTMAPLEPHGTSVFGQLFASGVEPAARGLLPDAEAAIFYRYTEASQFGGGRSRLSINRELIDPAGIYRAMFQTSSVGSEHTAAYTTITAEVDDYLYLTGLLSIQSQGNAAPLSGSARPRATEGGSRPQAWAKNIVSAGAIHHMRTAGREDDRWLSRGGASIGPAADGRIKPDLAFFYDAAPAPHSAADSAYTQFGGTSASAPAIAGHFGLFLQMWREGVWIAAGRGGADGAMPCMATSRAALISTAHRYDWNTAGPNSTISRNVQGWGVPDLRLLHELRDRTVIIDAADPFGPPAALGPLGVNVHAVDVAEGEVQLNIVMVYIDPAGAPSASVHRVNDLSLRAVSPSGLEYWGNAGLREGNFSRPGGTSDTHNTVECIFIAGPEAGRWTVQVHGDVILQDAHPSTAGMDATYSLWVTGARRSAPEGAEVLR